MIDDWDLSAISDSERRDFLEVIEDRHGSGALIMASQLPVSSWHEVIGEPATADAILDRIVHNAHRIELKGPSVRKRKPGKGSGDGVNGVIRAALRHRLGSTSSKEDGWQAKLMPRADADKKEVIGSQKRRKPDVKLDSWGSGIRPAPLRSGSVRVYAIRCPDSCN